MPLLDRDGVKIYYEDHGHRPPILLSHGYCATCRMWNGQISALVARHRVIVWDMRGHGESDDPADFRAYSEALTVEDMAALLRRCGIDRTVIGGLSLGGYMSLAFQLAHPERLSVMSSGLPWFAVSEDGVEDDDETPPAAAPQDRRAVSKGVDTESRIFPRPARPRPPVPCQGQTCALEARSVVFRHEPPCFFPERSRQ